MSLCVNRHLLPREVSLMWVDRCINLQGLNYKELILYYINVANNCGKFFPKVNFLPSFRFLAQYSARYDFHLVD